MKEIEIKQLIKSINVELDTDEWVGIKHQATSRYNKKCFFRCGCVFLVGLFFIYDTEVINTEVNYTFNSIVSVDTKGNNVSHDSFTAFISYLLSMPEVVSVDMS